MSYKKNRKHNKRLEYGNPYLKKSANLKIGDF